MKKNSAPASDAGRLVLGAWLALLGPALGPGEAQAGDAPEPIVIMVSFDGFRHDYMDRFETPHFDRVAHEGVRAEGLIPVFPTKTFPNHLSIATGVRPARHGIIDNKFYAPDRDQVYSMGDRQAVGDGSWYQAEPIWVTAERQGLRTAAFFWVGTEAPIQGIRPREWRRYDKATPNALRVETVLGWLDRPADSRPRLITLYFSDVDTAGHRDGPDSPSVRRAVERIDGVLGTLLDGIAARPAIAAAVHLILVSDHGMAAVKEIKTLPAIAITPRKQFGRGAYVSMWFDRPETADDYARAITERMPDLTTLVAGRYPAWTHLDGSPRAPHLMVMGEPGTAIVPNGGELHDDGGLHGYPPTERDMYGIFLAMGPGIRSGQSIEAFENIHVYPLIAEILQIEPHSDIDGELAVLGPILRAEPTALQTAR